MSEDDRLKEIEANKYIVGVELRDLYDGVLFWYNKQTQVTTIRCEPEWYENRNIDIMEVMKTWLTNYTVQKRPSISRH